MWPTPHGTSRLTVAPFVKQACPHGGHTTVLRYGYLTDPVTQPSTQSRDGGSLAGIKEKRPARQGPSLGGKQ